MRPLFPLILDISYLVLLKWISSFPYSLKPTKGKQQLDVLKLTFFKGGNLMIENLNKLSKQWRKIFSFHQISFFTTKITEKKLSFYFLSVELYIYKTASVYSVLKLCDTKKCTNMAIAIVYLLAFCRDLLSRQAFTRAVNFQIDLHGGQWKTIWFTSGCQFERFLSSVFVGCSNVTGKIILDPIHILKFGEWHAISFLCMHVYEIIIEIYIWGKNH